MEYLIIILSYTEILIGFERESYTGDGGNDVTEVCISVQQGPSLERSITVFLATGTVYEMHNTVVNLVSKLKVC